jgi:NADH dehydrogenase
MKAEGYSAFVPAGDRTDSGLHRIVIVGGGAGGLELAARLGDRAGRRNEAEVVLIDPQLTHLWKPLLHEVAAGTLGPEENEFDYLQQARQHHFRFHLGTLSGLDRDRKEVWLEPLIDEDGLEVAPHRCLWYDTLVLAVGCGDNDFGTAGVRQYALSLNGTGDAERFHHRLLSLCARAELRQEAAPVRIVIVGGGATGVELAAELAEAVREIASYGSHLSRFPQPVGITLVENGPRLLAALPEEVSVRIHAELLERGTEIRLGQRVVEVKRNRVTLKTEMGEEEIGADITAWAAGIKAPDILAGLGGLETSQLNQLVVRPTLQTTLDDDIFAIGDCASYTPRPGKPPIPPMAQAAQQEARLLARSLRRRLAGKPLLTFAFRYRGSLVSLGEHEAVGFLSTMIRGLRVHNLMVGGILARLSYWALYRRHLATLLGLSRTLLNTLGGWMSGRSHPRVKLH